MDQYREMAAEYAKKYNIDPKLYAALITQESGWNPSAVSPVGAAGLSQVMPATARDPGFGVSPLEDRDNPDEQLRFGAEYLRAMMDRYPGDTARALAAYNWGAGNADGWSGNMSELPDETRGYISNITSMQGLPAGPTKKRSMAGLPLSTRDPSVSGDQAGLSSDNPDQKKREYNKLQKVAIDKFGMNDGQIDAVGGGLQDIGQILLSGRFR